MPFAAVCAIDGEKLDFVATLQLTAGRAAKVEASIRELAAAPVTVEALALSMWRGGTA